jgi:hypothetical protein
LFHSNSRKNGKHFIIFGAKVSINIEVRNIPHVFFVFHEKKRKIVAAAMLRHGGTSERHRLEWPQQCCGTEDRDDDTNWNGRCDAAAWATGMTTPTGMTAVVLLACILLGYRPVCCAVAVLRQ